MLKIYLAGSYEQKSLFKTIQYSLRSLGFFVTSSWITAETRKPIDAKYDFDEIDESDVVIGFYPFRRGACTELTYAVVKGKITILVIDMPVESYPLITHLLKTRRNGFIISSDIFNKLFLSKEENLKIQNNIHYLKAALFLIKEKRIKDLKDFEEGLKCIDMDKLETPWCTRCFDEPIIEERSALEREAIVELEKHYREHPPAPGPVFGGMCNFCEKFNRKKGDNKCKSQ
jgi:hypothetical protein